MIYLALYAALVLTGCFSAGNGSARRFFFIAWAFILYVFVAFRYEVGCDWSGYALHYESSNFVDTTEALLTSEPAYWAILNYLRNANFEYPYLNVVLAIPFFAGMIHLGRRQPDGLAFLILSFPVLIINLPMSGIRQAAAVGLICFAFVSFQDKRLIRYVAFVILASLFHMSALAFLAMAPFVVFPVTRWTILAAITLFLPGAYFMLADTFSIYSDRYIDAGAEAAGAIYRSGMLAATGAFFMLVLRKKYEQRYPNDYKLAFVGALIMMATLPVVVVSTVISDRFGYYVTPIQLMILARIPYLVQSRNQALLTAAPYLALGLVLLVWTSHSELFNKCYLPYQNWLF